MSTGCAHPNQAYDPSMPKLRWILLFLSALCGIAPPIQACRSNQPPPERLARGYDRKIISAVALVRITNAKYLAEPIADSHPWRVSGRIERVYRGGFATETVQFERGFGSSWCDDGEAMPNPGDLWVVYYWKMPEGKQAVWQSYPMKVAIGADPRLPSSDD